MSGGHDDDVGRAYLETQQALGQICGENRPTLVLFMPFFFCRQLPPSSVSFRRLPSASVSGRVWSVWRMETCLGARETLSGGISGNPTGPGPNLWRKSADSSADYSISMLPSASVCFRQLPSASVSVRYLPSASISGRIWSVWMMATCLGARMMMSGEHIWNPNMPRAKFAGEIDLF